uniref:uncharacterized protein n=1 Tax=Lonchura striata TaxID=40157 RepID=UPI000B4CD610|nr:uncharacterized protein LOC110483998 [Lonchura striata domestica]
MRKIGAPGGRSGREEIIPPLKNISAVKKMAYPVACSNQVDRRDREIASGDGGSSQIVRKNTDHHRHGNGDNGMRKSRNVKLGMISSIPCSVYYSALKILTFVMICFPLQSVATETHEPFKWTLSRWENHDTHYNLQTVITPGAPSFKAGVCNMTKNPSCGWLLNLTSFYMCPASNLGRSYCNLPRHYYCGYWGCETIASAWAPGGGSDKYLRVGYGPAGCVKPQEWPWTGKDLLGNCTFIYLNVIHPNDPGWLLGKTWGIRHWIEGHDLGNLIIIKKEPIPYDPAPIGPNKVISDIKTKTINYTETEVITNNQPSSHDHQEAENDHLATECDCAEETRELRKGIKTVS